MENCLPWQRDKPLPGIIGNLCTFSAQPTPTVLVSEWAWVLVWASR